MERKAKRPRGGGAESDGSAEDDAHLPPGKRRRGPRTPPGPSLRPGPAPPPKMDANFSDWSDEEVGGGGGGGATETAPPPRPDRGPPPPAERAPVELLRRGGAPRRGRERERGNVAAPAIAPLLPQEPPHLLLPTLPPQPLMSQPLLRKPLPEGSRGVGGGLQNRGALPPSSRRLRSPSGEPAGREDPPGARPGGGRRGRMQGAPPSSRDRERAGPGEHAFTERKSRIDQLRRGEPSRSTSSGERTHALTHSLIH